MMERLTTKWNDGSYDTFDPIDIVDNEYSKANYERVLAKLGEYEDLEEQGLLLKLPCKVGDDVWCIEEYEDGFECVCYRFMTLCGDYCIVTAFYQHCESYEVQLEEMVDDCENWGHTEVNLFHKSSVFLTKEEAEEALRKLVE